MNLPVMMCIGDNHDFLSLLGNLSFFCTGKKLFNDDLQEILKKKNFQIKL